MSFDQTNNLLKKDGDNTAQSAQNKLQTEATEHTLAGAAIGAVRDVIPGLHGSASGNDQIAQIAADAVASLPVVKTVVGGAIRATMLIDPTKGFEANLGGFGVNFVEGAALNKVSRLAMPESGFSTVLQSRFGTGLATEAATHLTAGFGFGAIRTGFNGDSWKDASGNFDLKTGAENLLKGGAVGALINLPAGMVGFRVAKLSGSALENSIVSPRLASVITNAGAGYAAGGVYGGVDAVMAGKNFSDVMKGINEGGLIGAATGGAIGAFDRGAISARTQDGKTAAPASENNLFERTSAPANEQAREVLAVPVRESESVQVAGDGNRAKNWMREGSDTENVEFVGRLKLDAPAYDLLSIERSLVPRIADIQHRLTSYAVQSESHYEPTEGSEGPWKDFAEFKAQALKPVDQDFRVYKLNDGVNTEIALPESYAKKLDEVRALRLKAEQPSALDDLPSGHSLSVQQMVKNNDAKLFRHYFDDETAKQILPIVWARIKLSEHEFGNRALPEDILSLLDEQPAKEKIQRINMYPGKSPYNKWFEQVHNEEGFEASATASESEGGISLYAAKKSDQSNSQFRDTIRATFAHERAHLYEPTDKNYQDAALLDKDGYYVSKYSKKNVDERWAEDTAKGFLVPDVDQFLIFAEQAPVRAVVMAREIERQIESSAPKDHGKYNDDIMLRCKFVEHQVMPLARQQLAEQLYLKDADMQQAALRLLREFGARTELKAVMHAAYQGETPEVRKSAFDLAVSLQGPSLKDRFEFVWQEGLPDKPARDIAIRQMRLYGTRNENAASYANLLQYAGDRDYPQLAKQVTRMFTDEGSERAYELAMKMGAHVKGYQQEVALSALLEVPSLRVRALHSLNNQPPENVAPVVRRFVDDSDPEVAQAAQEVLRGVELRTQIADMQKVFDRTGEVDPRVIAALGASGDSRSIPPLLQVIVKGSDAARGQALDALAQFDPNIVKYQARLAKLGHSPTSVQNLKYVLDYNLSKRAHEHE